MGGVVSRWLPLALLLGGCPDYARLCAQNDPSVDPERCWSAGFDQGYTDTHDAAYSAAYDSGLAACEADLAAQ